MNKTVYGIKHHTFCFVFSLFLEDSLLESLVIAKEKLDTKDGYINQIILSISNSLRACSNKHKLTKGPVLKVNLEYLKKKNLIFHL